MALGSVEAYLEALCPLLYASPLRAVYIDIATDSTSAGYFGNQYYYAIALGAAHYFTIDNNRPDGEAGLVTAKTEGRLSIHYWNEIPEGSASSLHMTTYGKRLWELMRRTRPTISVCGTRLPGAGMVTEEE